MSKRELKAYLNGLKKKQLEAQVLDLYTRFNTVKTYYNFVFKPNEEKLLTEAKFKISKEYFPINSRKPKKRRSVAQKIIKHFIQLGVDAYVVSEIMLFNIETALKYNQCNRIKQDAFYKSIAKSFKEAVEYINEKGLKADFDARIKEIITESRQQKWINTLN